MQILTYLLLILALVVVGFLISLYQSKIPVHIRRLVTFVLLVFFMGAAAFAMSEQGVPWYKTLPVISAVVAGWILRASVKWFFRQML